MPEEVSHLISLQLYLNKNLSTNGLKEAVLHLQTENRPVEQEKMEEEEEGEEESSDDSEEGGESGVSS